MGRPFSGGLELDEEFQVVAEVPLGCIDAALEIAELLEDEGVDGGKEILGGIGAPFDA